MTVRKYIIVICIGMKQLILNQYLYCRSGCSKLEYQGNGPEHTWLYTLGIKGKINSVFQIDFMQQSLKKLVLLVQCVQV